jgi:hypothetical protein
MVVRKVLNSLLPEGGRYGGQEGFKLNGHLLVTKFKTFLTTITDLLVTMSLKPS